MNILIIEDNQEKAEAIRAFISLEMESLQEALTVRISTYLSEAVRLVSATAYDFIVLDLMLPYLHGSMPAADAGIEMINQIRHNESINMGAVVVGLSAYPDEVEEFRHKFDRAGILIAQYDDSAAWQCTLRQTLLDVLRRRTVKRNVDFLIFTALEEERVGFNQTDLIVTREAIIGGLNVREVTLTEGDRTFTGALIKLRQMGLAAAILDATVALGAFQARAVCMSGVCAGFAGRVRLGQLIIASPAWEYQAGKWSSNGFQIAPSQIPLPSRTRVILDQIIGASDFQLRMETNLGRHVSRPRQWVDPILAPAATGSAVVADVKHLVHIEQQHRKVAALDMETFGIYYAAHEVASQLQHYFSIKCVVDLADAEKDDDLHEYGCVVSARAALYIIRRLLAGS